MNATSRIYASVHNDFVRWRASTVQTLDRSTFAIHIDIMCIRGTYTMTDSPGHFCFELCDNTTITTIRQHAREGYASLESDSSQSSTMCICGTVRFSWSTALSQEFTPLIYQCYCLHSAQFMRRTQSSLMRIVLCHMSFTTTNTRNKRLKYKCNPSRDSLRSSKHTELAKYMKYPRSEF